MKLFLYQDHTPRGEARESSDALILKALKAYCSEDDILLDSLPAILRRDLEKPVFDRGGIHFSVSHTDDLWACLMAGQPVGLDLQKKKPARWWNIANRFFTEEEKDHLKKEGEDAFWKIWVMKEAYVKYLGTTLARGIGRYAMVDSGRLLQQVNGTTLKMIEIKEEIYGACAFMGEEEICIRKLK